MALSNQYTTTVYFSFLQQVKFLALLVYLDDILITGDSETEIRRVKRFLDQEFTIKDMQHTKYFLGLELSRSEVSIYMNQRKYTLDLI